MILMVNYFFMYFYFQVMFTIIIRPNVESEDIFISSSDPVEFKTKIQVLFSINNSNLNKKYKSTKTTIPNKNHRYFGE